MFIKVVLSQARFWIDLFPLNKRLFNAKYIDRIQYSFFFNPFSKKRRSLVQYKQDGM